MWLSGTALLQQAQGPGFNVQDHKNKSSKPQKDAPLASGTTEIIKLEGNKCAKIAWRHWTLPALLGHTGQPHSHEPATPPDVTYVHSQTVCMFTAKPSTTLKHREGQVSTHALAVFKAHTRSASQHKIHYFCSDTDGL